MFNKDLDLHSKIAVLVASTRSDALFLEQGLRLLQEGRDDPTFRSAFREFMGNIPHIEQGEEERKALQGLADFEQKLIQKKESAR